MKAELKKVCCQLCNLYRLFMYFSCAAISVVIHRRGKIMIFHQMAILVFVILPELHGVWLLLQCRMINHWLGRKCHLPPYFLVEIAEL